MGFRGQKGNQTGLGMSPDAGSKWCRSAAVVMGTERRDNRMKTRGQRFNDGAEKKAERGTLGSQLRHRHPDKKLVICTHNFTARNNNELSVLQEDLLEVLDDSKKWWKVQNRYGQVGYVPYNILSPVSTGEESDVQNHKRTAQVNGTSPVVSKKVPPQPPPKTKGVYSNGRSWASTEALNMDLSDRERFNTVNEELALRLANGSTARKNLQIQRAPDTNVPLRYDSNTAEVQTWLEAKGFNPFTVKAFGVLSGAQLFSLQKDEFKAVSPEEGARVYSQVTVQRALLEDSGKVSELEAVMKKQKRKLEGMSE